MKILVLFLLLFFHLFAKTEVSRNQAETFSFWKPFKVSRLPT